jgi:hypothetical protein
VVGFWERQVRIGRCRLVVRGRKFLKNAALVLNRKNSEPRETLQDANREKPLSSKVVEGRKIAQGRQAIVTASFWMTIKLY